MLFRIITMLSNLLDKVKSEFRNGNAVHKLLLANIAFFAIVVLIQFFDWILHTGVTTGWANSFTEVFSISSDWKNILKRIWTPFTSMFLHARFGHILFNLFALMMFGNIVGDLVGDRRVLPLYLLGGLVGNLFFFVSANLLHPSLEHVALGASGAIMALAGAAVALAPDYRVNLILLGAVPLKYIVVFMILADLVGIAGNYNTGGHFAHLGGFIFGWLFIKQLHDGNDMSEKINDLFDQIAGIFLSKKLKSSRKKEPIFTVTKGGRNPQREVKHSRPETLDAILDKIRLQGLASLTEEEKRFLDSLKDNP